MPHPSTPLVRATRLYRYYQNGGRRIPALHAASFDICPNEHIALIGPSGSGKSTLLGLVAGLDRGDEGTIEWPALSIGNNGRPREIMVAFQAPSLIPSLTVLENCLLPLILAGQSTNDDTAHASLALFGIADLADRLPEQISGGQAQRAALARAVAGKPRLLIADEPTGQLDQVTRTSVIEALTQWGSETGCALLVASHDPDVASRLGTIWTIEHGKLVCPSRGTTKDVAFDRGSAA